MIHRKYAPIAPDWIDAKGSRPQPYEHLMIMCFDILLLDDNICLRAPHRERRLLLQEVVQKIPGRSDIAEQELVDFDHADSHGRLETSFAKAIAQRWEGYVLKASDEPYFPIYAAGVDESFGRWIKLKKDYIPGLGDAVDLALIGACYNAQDAAALTSIQNLRWTHFLVGCLLNKEAVMQNESKPHYRIVDVIDRHSMHWKLLQLLNQHGEFYAADPVGFEGFAVEYGRRGLPAASVVFKRPFIVEMMGSGFEKPSGARYYSLRFPRILKIHTERTPEDAASFRELQLLAEDARSVPVDELAQEEEQWRKRLKVGNGLKDYIVRRSRSPSTDSSSSTGSDVPAGSDTPMGDHEDGLQSISLQKSADKESPARPNHNQPLDSINITPIFVDESRMSFRITQLPHNDDVLAENQNLSKRRTSSQGALNVSGENDRCTPNITSRASQFGTAATSSSGPQIDSHCSSQPQNTRRTHEQVNSTQTEDSSSLERPSEQKMTPLSPLTTIPVYMSGNPSRDDRSPEEQDSSTLSQFLQALGSDETISLFKRSNPQAARQGAVFGIVLVSPSESPLGQVIHKLAKRLSWSLQNQSSLPTNGRIFFLDAAILAEKINSESIEFCLRQTWRTLGHKHYYACLRWNSVNRHVDKGAGSETRVACPDGIGQGVSDGPSQALFVSFDQDQILALGEYTSLDGLTDPTAMTSEQFNV